MPNFTQVSFDLLSKIKKSTDTDQICSILEDASHIFGYETFVIAEAPLKSHDNLQDRLMLGRLPAQWSERYEECGYIHHDPVVAHTRRMNGLFRWSEAPVGRDERLARTIMGEASEIGLRDGYCIPIQDLTCTRIVSFGGAHLDLPDQAVSGLHMLGIYADLAVRDLRRPGPAATAGAPAGSAALLAARDRVHQVGRRRQDRLGDLRDPVAVAPHRRKLSQHGGAEAGGDQPRPSRGAGLAPRPHRVTGLAGRRRAPADAATVESRGITTADECRIGLGRLALRPAAQAPAEPGPGPTALSFVP
ncbi:autoinducer binding domain-containing protein [Methylobacterium aquaticum]|uniref:autoinducer binding domain-containing protein n=1 Tax=Methylobacterium aquaticum TaxID=270351 RepID=UPI003D165BCD